MVLDLLELICISEVAPCINEINEQMCLIDGQLFRETEIIRLHSNNILISKIFIISFWNVFPSAQYLPDSSLKI